MLQFVKAREQGGETGGENLISKTFRSRFVVRKRSPGKHVQKNQTFNSTLILFTAAPSVADTVGRGKARYRFGTLALKSDVSIGASWSSYRMAAFPRLFAGLKALFVCYSMFPLFFPSERYKIFLPNGNITICDW